MLTAYGKKTSTMRFTNTSTNRAPALPNATNGGHKSSYKAEWEKETCMNRVFYDDEKIVGVMADVVDDLDEKMKEAIDKHDWDQMESFGEYVDLIKELIGNFEEDDLVLCEYHPMGAWVVSRLIKEA